MTWYLLTLDRTVKSGPATLSFAAYYPRAHIIYRAPKPMVNAAKNLEGEALKLSLSDRAWLAERLLSSLDEIPIESVEDLEKAWLEEANRRFEAYRADRMSGQKAQDAIADLLAERD